MSLIFIEGEKKIEFNVINYQYPERVATEDYDYDANWLMVEIAYSNRAEKNTYYDPCLLTYEFIDLIDGIEANMEKQRDVQKDRPSVLSALSAEKKNLKEGRGDHGKNQVSKRTLCYER